MRHGLCDRCKESYGIALIDPWIHCHHDKEEPKEKCWCEYPASERNNYNVTVRNKVGLPEFVWYMKYCPVCRRALEE